ncbi:DUF1905 domain-containing protein [Streptomyces sp. NPDC056628]|uniref:DUF1905 domain-containing protein n=1 Tax=Streptomyces sp. NPDC056628 TaxID=3345882 RepID=UPI0036C32A23
MEESADIRDVAATATSGWGVVPVEARIGLLAFETSLFPRGGGCLLPLTKAVRASRGLGPDGHRTAR